MVKFRKIAFLTMAAVLLSTCATGISNLSESRVGGQYTVYAAETQADAGESVATLTDATATVKNKKGCIPRTVRHIITMRTARR